MKKNYLTIGLTLSVMMVGFAQTSQQKLKEEHDKKMTLIEQVLERKETFNSLKLEKTVTGDQFFVEKSFLKKENTLYSVLKDISNGKVLFSIDSIDFSPIQINDVMFLKKGDGKFDKENNPKNTDRCEQYTTKNEVFSQAQSKDGKKSKVKNRVTYTWLVTYDRNKENKEVKKAESLAKKQFKDLPKEEKNIKIEAARKEAEEKIEKNRIVESIKIKEVKSTLIKFLTIERQAMKDIAEKLIKEWYDSLTLETLKNEEQLMNAFNFEVGTNNIVVDLPNSLNFSVKGEKVPTITVNVDPYKYITQGEEYLYSNPKAYFIVYPNFTISINDDLKTGKITEVKYLTKFFKPETDAIIIEKTKNNRVEANRTITDFINKIVTYTQNLNKETKMELNSLFVDKNCVVEVSNLTENGVEKIIKRNAQDYISRLMQATIIIDGSEPEFLDSTMEVAEIFMTQSFKSERYSDITEKKITLKKNTNERGVGYLIEKIEVVKGSTKNNK